MISRKFSGFFRKPSDFLVDIFIKKSVFSNFMKNSGTKNSWRKIFHASGMGALTIFCITSCMMIMSSSVYALKITEIMFNPQGSDTGMEWVEISFNETDGCLNLSGYKFNEGGMNHNINAYRNKGYCSYAIISDDADKFLSTYTYLNDSSNAMLDEVSIYKSSFSLSNSGENISITKSGETIDEVDYADILKVVNATEGYSIEYYPETMLWKISGMASGNPGNIFLEYPVTEYNITDNNTIIGNNSDDNVTGDDSNNNTDNSPDNNTIDENESANDIINTSTNNCNISLKINIRNESQFYEDDAQIRFNSKIEMNCTTQVAGSWIKSSDLDYIIEYWIEDLQGNIIKSRTSTNNQDDKSFTPKISEKDSIFIIRSELKAFGIIEGNDACNMTSSDACLNYNIINGSASKIILIKDSDYTAPQEKSCPSCSSGSSKSSSCGSSSSSKSQASTASYVPQCAACNQTPIIRTLLFCNESLLNRYSMNVSQNVDLKGASIIGIGQDGISSTSDDKSSITNISDVSGSDAHSQLTGAIVYESPNVKNRFYALIGLVIVVLACAGIILYKMHGKSKEDIGKDN